MGGGRDRRAVDDRPAVGVRRVAALGPRRSPPRPGRRGGSAAPAARPRRGRLARLLRHPPGQDGRVRARWTGRRHLPRRGRHQPGQRRSDRRSPVVAGGHRRLDVRGAASTAGHSPPSGPASAAPAPTGGVGMRIVSLGDEAVIDVNEFRLNGVDMAPVRQAVSRRPARRLPPRRAAARRDPARRDGDALRARRALAWRRARAWLLDVARPARRPRRRALRDGDRARRLGSGAGAAVVRAMGPARAVARSDAPRPGRRQRRRRVHGGRHGRRRPRLGRAAPVAELRRAAQRVQRCRAARLAVPCCASPPPC